ncbi:putative F-box protein At3g16210 [Aegilops tauschii subsp. strangulata]|nr:putative F-box protein At3g16210 [Aegilops tauschii subsp. strangulata]
MTSCRRRRRSLTPAALDDDDLLLEILLRLPPQPSSLPRASLVCKRWRSLASDPGFLRCFRIHHRRSPPLLGCFVEGVHGVSFLPTMEAPNRVPPRRLSFQPANEDHFRLLNCRHGLVLIYNRTRRRLLVWDPITGDQHHVAIPVVFHNFLLKTTEVSGAVLRAGKDVQHFKVVCVATCYDDVQAALAYVYYSETSSWGELISTPIPRLTIFDTRISWDQPAVLVGDALYWLLTGGSEGILEFDFEKNSLAVIQYPVDVYRDQLTVIRTYSGALGFLHVSNFTARLWERKPDYDGVPSWELGRTIELDKLLSLHPMKLYPIIRGFAEDNNVVFLGTAMGDIFSVQLQSLQFNNLPQTDVRSYVHPFESVYTGGNSMPYSGYI